MNADAPKQPDLTAARAEVLALVAGSPMSMGLPKAQAATALRPLPPALEAKLTTRAAAGLEPTGRRYPHSGVWRRVVLPSAVFALADAVGVGVAAAGGNTVLAIAAAVLFVPLAALAAFGARFALRDPLRVSAADRRAIAAASRWTSKQAWTGAIAHGSERGLVMAAARAAERIAATATWRSGQLDEQRLRLDLGAELDQTDEQAHRIAVARAGGRVAAGGDPVTDEAWEATVNRVAALTAYAEQLDGQDRWRAEAMTRLGDPVRDSNLMAGSVRDEMASDELLALAFYLSANQAGGSGSDL